MSTTACDKTEDDRRLLRIPARYLFALLGFVSFLSIYALRASIGIIMIDMVRDSGRSNLLASDVCEVSGKINETIDNQENIEGEFNWSERTQGIIFGSFFWGYLLLQLPAGRLAERSGGKWLYGGGVLCSGIFSLIMPISARLGLVWLIGVRFICGLAEGLMYPAMQNMLSKVALPSDKGKLATLIYAGGQCGALVGIPVAGLLCNSGLNEGWPMVFYCFGSVSVLWFVAYAFFVYGSSPCPELSKHSQTDKPLTFPWKHALTSLPVWAIIISHFSNDWAYYTLVTEMPMYMKHILKFDIKQNSLFSAMPYLGRWIFAVAGSYIADYLRNSKKVSSTTVTKTANFVGIAFPGFFLIAIPFIGCGKLWNVATLSLSIATGGFMYAGCFCNHVQLAPRFSGTLFAMTNTVATVAGIVSPYVAGVLIDHHQSLHQWHLVFYISAGISIFAAIFYCVFASGEVQSWNSFASVDDETTHLNIRPYLSDYSLAKSNVVVISVKSKDYVDSD